MWDMPWTESEILIAERIKEEFLKRGKGDFKVSFTLPINWIEAFDILTNFRLQEPFGIDGSNNPPAERGEKGRYYYIESITYDFMNQKMNIIAVDLQFILQQIMIVPHCGDVAETWAAAGLADRMYAYVGSCDTDSFADGSPLKKVAPCGICE